MTDELCAIFWGRDLDDLIDDIDHRIVSADLLRFLERLFRFRSPAATFLSSIERPTSSCGVTTIGKIVTLPVRGHVDLYIHDVF